MWAVDFRRLFFFFFLCSTLTILPFIDNLFSIIGFDDETVYEEPPVQKVSRTNSQSKLSPAIAPNYFKASVPGLHLPGVKGTKRLPGLYHLESRAWVPEEYGWQCGLHMLYNICNIERAFGLSDINDYEFVVECERVPRVFEEAGSFPTDLKKIANRIARCPLHIVEHDDYADRIDLLYESDAEARFWSRIHARLSQPGIQCEHFGCLIYAEECHIFLISVVKMPDGKKALYLLDNVNYDESRQAQYQMYRHAKYIHDHIFQ